MIQNFVRVTLPLALLIAPAAALAGPASEAGFQPSEWRNPKNSVHIRAANCGSNLCGTVTWANSKAREDAAAAGEPELIGTQILRDFQPDGPRSWRGSVFVPDVGRTFAGKLTFVDSNTMVGKGCVLFGLLCKSQVWTRLR